MEAVLEGERWEIRPLHREEKAEAAAKDHKLQQAINGCWLLLLLVLCESTEIAPSSPVYQFMKLFLKLWKYHFNSFSMNSWCIFPTMGNVSSRYFYTARLQKKGSSFIIEDGRKKPILPKLLCAKVGEGSRDQQINKIVTTSPPLSFSRKIISEQSIMASLKEERSCMFNKE